MESATPRVLRLSAALFAVFVFVVSAWHWWSFQYRTFDLAFYVQGLWLALRGQWHVSLLDVSILGNHVEPLVFLILPLFALCPHPLVLVAVQTAALATMPFTAWRIARRLGIEERAAFWLALSVILMPATGFVGLHEFHPEAFVAPLLLLLIEARLAGRYGWFWVWFVAVLACKENLALLLVAWGGVHALWDWRRRAREQWLWNLAPLLVAAAWFLVCTRLITPALNAGKVDYVELYSHLGKTGGEIILGFFTQPQVALGALWRAVTRGNLVWGLLLPLLSLPLLRPRWLLIGTPILLQHLLSWRSSEWMINFHYAAPLVPLVWVAAAQASASTRHVRPLARAIAIACVASQFAFGPARALVAELPQVPAQLQERGWKAEMLARIPPTASVSAGLPYLHHLAKREELYSLHHVLKGLNTLSRTRYQPPVPPDCVLLDYADTATFDRTSGYYHPPMRTVTGEIVPSSDQLLHAFLRPVRWRAEQRGSFTLLAQNDVAHPSEPEVMALAVWMNASTVLTRCAWSAETPKTEDGMVRLKKNGSAILELAWQFEGSRAGFPWLSLWLQRDEGEFVLTKGLCAIESDDRAFEKWSVVPLSSIPPGRYRARAVFTDQATIEKSRSVLHARELGEVEIPEGN